MCGCVSVHTSAGVSGPPCSWSNSDQCRCQELCKSMCAFRHWALSSPWSLTLGGYLFWLPTNLWRKNRMKGAREERKEGEGRKELLSSGREFTARWPLTHNHLCNSGTVSTLCAYTSNPDSATFSTALRSPRKSGVRHSTRILGFLGGKGKHWTEDSAGRSAAHTDCHHWLQPFRSPWTMKEGTDTERSYVSNYTKPLRTVNCSTARLGRLPRQQTAEPDF